MEELEDRLSEQMEDILTLVRNSLPGTSSVTVRTTGLTSSLSMKDEDAEGEIVGNLAYPDAEGLVDEWEETEMMEFVDTEGAFEGDLDAEEIDE